MKLTRDKLKYGLLLAEKINPEQKAEIIAVYKGHNPTNNRQYTYITIRPILAPQTEDRMIPIYGIPVTKTLKSLKAQYEIV